MQLLVRNKVKDFSTWYAYFEEDGAVAAEYGADTGVTLRVTERWQETELAGSFHQRKGNHMSSSFWRAPTAKSPAKRIPLRRFGYFP